MAAAGLILSNARHSAALYPDLFSSPDAAKKAIGRALAGRRILDLECAAALTVRVRYQVSGPRMAAAEALAAPNRLLTLRPGLETALGPLALFDITLPTAKEIAAMSDVDKLALRNFTQGAVSLADATARCVPGGYGGYIDPATMFRSSSCVVPQADFWTAGAVTVLDRPKNLWTLRELNHRVFPQGLKAFFASIDPDTIDDEDDQDDEPLSSEFSQITTLAVSLWKQGMQLQCMGVRRPDAMPDLHLVMQR
jgi:hypothetical protein